MECVLRAAVLFFDGDTSELSHIRVLLGTDETEIARDFFREKNKERRHWSLVQDGGGSRELDEKQRAFTEVQAQAMLQRVAQSPSGWKDTVLVH